MLSFLQRYEALMLQKFYVNVVMVWEWKFDLACHHSSVEQTLHNVSWGPNRTMFRMLMRRNDNMLEMEGVNNGASSAGCAASSNSQDSYGDQVINPQILFGQRVADGSSALNLNGSSLTPDRQPALCTSWHDVVHVSPYVPIHNSSSSSETISSQFKVITEELKRMLNEWLLLPPRTRMQFNDVNVTIEAGDVRAVHAQHCIPYAAKVFQPVRLNGPFQLELDALSLMDLHRFLHCVPNDWANTCCGR